MAEGVWGGCSAAVLITQAFCLRSTPPRSCGGRLAREQRLARLVAGVLQRLGVLLEERQHVGRGGASRGERGDQIDRARAQEPLQEREQRGQFQRQLERLHGLHASLLERLGVRQLARLERLVRLGEGLHQLFQRLAHGLALGGVTGSGSWLMLAPSTEVLWARGPIAAWRTPATFDSSPGPAPAAPCFDLAAIARAGMGADIAGIGARAPGPAGGRGLHRPLRRTSTGCTTVRRWPPWTISASSTATKAVKRVSTVCLTEMEMISCFTLSSCEMRNLSSRSTTRARAQRWSMAASGASRGSSSSSYFLPWTTCR